MDHRDPSRSCCPILRIALVLCCVGFVCAAEGQDWILQWEALDRQAQDADQADAVLAVVTGAGSAGLRGRALVALARHQPQRAVEAVTAFAAAQDAVQRAAAAEAAGWLRDGESGAVAKTLLQDPDPDVALLAALAVARRDGGSAWQQVREQVAAYDPQRALLQARILATVGTEAAAARWDEFKDQAGQARHDLVRGLAWASGPHWRLRMQEALVAWHTHRAASSAILSLPETEYVALIDACLAADSDRYHSRATQLLFGRPVQVGLDHLARLLEAGELEAGSRQLALDLLRADLGSSHPRIVSRYLADEDRELRRRAVHLAAGIEDDQTLFQLLRPAMGDQHLDVVREAVAVIAQTTDGVPKGGILDFIQPALAREDQWDIILEALKLVRWRLEETEIDRALTVLRPFLFHSNNDVRKETRAALERAGSWRVAQAQGYVARWQVIGPFDNDPDNSGFAKAFPPEGGVDLSASYPVGERHAESGIEDLRWKPAETDAGGHLLLHTQLPSPVEYNLAYAYAEFSVPQATAARLVVEGDDAVAVWLNGERVHAIGGERRVSVEKDQESRQERRRWWDDKRHEHGSWWPASEGTVEVRMQAGRNRLLVKCANLDIYWWFRLRLLDADDKPLEVDW